MGNYYALAIGEDMTHHLHKKRKRQKKLSASAFHEMASTVISDHQTLPCYRPRIAIRKLSRATDTRTIITALVPGEVLLTDHSPYLLRLQGTAKDEAYVLGVLSSMILDWFARTRVERNVNYHIINTLPIPRMVQKNAHLVRRVVMISGRLAAVDGRFAEWAAEVGVPVGSVSHDALKRDLICELDACAAHLYGLDERDLAILYGTFHEGTIYKERHTAVLEHFRRWGRG